MPYNKQTSRDAIAKNLTLGTKDEGDACYVYATYFFSLYKANPRWATIHKMRKLVRHPQPDDALMNIEAALSGTFTSEDRETARDLAFIEFYRRIGGLHEDVKCLENGDCFDPTVIPMPKIGLNASTKNSFVS